MQYEVQLIGNAIKIVKQNYKKEKKIVKQDVKITPGPIPFMDDGSSTFLLLLL
jgi:hypothetical protein